MDTPRKIVKKIYDAITSPISRFLGLTEAEVVFYSPITSPKSKNNDVVSDSPTNSIIPNEDKSTSLKDTKNSSLITIDKKDYDSLIDKISNLTIENAEKTKKEEEWKQVVLDYDASLNFVIESNSEYSPLKKTLEEKDKLVKYLQDKLYNYENKIEKLTSILSGLEKDLLSSEERAEAYKSIATEKIEILKMENERIRRFYENDVSSPRKGNVDEISKELEVHVFEPNTSNHSIIVDEENKNFIDEHEIMIEEQNFLGEGEMLNETQI